MKAWRQRQCSGGNSGAAAPPALTIISVGDAGAGLFDWLFTGTITVTPGLCNALEVFDPDAGIYKPPTVVASGGGAHLTATYDFAFTSGTPWRVNSQPTAVLQAVAVPESGNTL